MTDGGAVPGTTVVEADPVNRIINAYHDEWRKLEGTPDLAAFWKAAREPGLDETRGLAALIKADLRWRYARGDRPSVADYLERFPSLREARERMVSLVYEEYCLREERGEGIDTEEFCGRYASLEDSIASQLRYHRMFSQMVASPATPKFPRAGDEFSRFRLLKEMGRGGSARVFQAEEMDLGRRLVVLKISTDKGEEPSIQGRLDHPHIARVLSVVRPEEGGLRGLTMPYRPGKTLDEVIRRVRPATRPAGAKVLREALAELGPSTLPSTGWHGFPETAGYARGVAWLMSKIARALAHAHEREILHRDIKPANILLTTTDGPVLLDFNLAHAPNATDEAAAALRGGTLPYMAPEQLRAFLDDAQWDSVGYSADLYAAGLILTELLTGSRPEVPDPELPLPRAIRELLDGRSMPRRSVRSQNPTVPHALDAVIDRCLRPNPAERYASAAALADDLEAIAAGDPLRHAVNTSRVETSLNWLSRKRATLAVVAATALIVGVLMLVVRPFAANQLIRDAEVANENGRFTAAADKLRAAEWLSPRDPRVESGLGQVEYGQRRYSRSLARFDRALQLAAARPDSLTDFQTACLLYRRSLAGLDWVQSLQGGPSTPRPAILRGRILSARNDLRSADRLAGGDIPLLYRIGMSKLHAEIQLAELAALENNHVDAFEYYVNAQARVAYLERLKPRHPQAKVWKLAVEESNATVQNRLAVELPRMLGIE
jgi:serine/threonine protein kinase